LNGNTFLVETQTGTAGVSDTTVVEVVGVHTFTGSTAGHIIVAS